MPINKTPYVSKKKKTETKKDRTTPSQHKTMKETLIPSLVRLIPDSTKVNKAPNSYSSNNDYSQTSLVLNCENISNDIGGPTNKI